MTVYYEYSNTATSDKLRLAVVPTEFAPVRACKVWL